MYMNAPHRAYFFDLDHTLFDTDHYSNDLKAHFGISYELWEGTRAALHARDDQYKLENHFALLREVGITLPNATDFFQTPFSNFRNYLFDDVPFVLKKLHEQKSKIFLLSHGLRADQEAKITHAGIRPFFNELIITKKTGEKGLAVRNLADAYDQIVIVDNYAPELDAVKSLIPQSHTYLINRVPQEFLIPKDEVARLRYHRARALLLPLPLHPHVRCGNLETVLRREGIL